MSAFERLHPQLRHAIVNDLGWRSLRPVQELTIEAVLDGANSVVLAPTAGGKTEAALFPVLSRILGEELAPVAALYVCPIRALLNNQEPRLGQYARMVGLEVFKWHGDVAQSRKAAFQRRPVHILCITPESLEVMLMNQRAEAARLFSSLSMVVIDEVHAFAGDDRGAHLLSVIERLVRFCGRDLQRVGLSATVGNPEEIGSWLQGSSQRPFRLVDPPRPRPERDLAVDFVPEPGQLASAVARLSQGRKSLVFVESRSQAERIASAVAGRGVDVFVHHSAVSRADRQLAEERFTSGQNTAIVCTSTLELGIDVGDLDQVLQVDAPATVASLLQRMGRTGRRAGTRSNCTFLCESGESLLQVGALLRLLEQGWVEPVRPTRRAAHVLAHQILALTLQEKGISRHLVSSWIARATPFQELAEADVQELIETMLGADILTEADGRLLLGARGERLYGARNFFELYAVFSAPQNLLVMHAGAEVGLVQGFFLRGAVGDSGPVSFRLGGRAWQVRHIDWTRGVCNVDPAESGRVPSWMGAPRHLSWTLCQEMKRLLREGPPSVSFSSAAAGEFAALRDGYAGLVELDRMVLEQRPQELQWHTFAGGAINRVLSAALETSTGRRWISGNLSLRSREAQGIVETSSVVSRLQKEDLERSAAGLANAGTGPTLSKFEPCLSQRFVDELWAGRMVDIAGAADVLAAQRTVVVQTA